MAVVIGEASTGSPAEDELRSIGAIKDRTGAKAGVLYVERAPHAESGCRHRRIGGISYRYEEFGSGGADADVTPGLISIRVAQRGGVSPNGQIVGGSGSGGGDVGEDRLRGLCGHGS